MKKIMLLLLFSLAITTVPAQADIIDDSYIVKLFTPDTHEFCSPPALLVKTFSILFSSYMGYLACKHFSRSNKALYLHITWWGVLTAINSWAVFRCIPKPIALTETL